MRVMLCNAKTRESGQNCMPVTRGFCMTKK